MLTLLILAFTLISAQSDLDVGKKALLKQDYSAAIKAFTQSIEKEQTPTNLGFRATAFLSISKHANAISDYSLILKLKPDHKQTLINRANAYLAIGLFDNAIEDAVSLNDDSIFKDATSAKADYLRALKSACPDAISLYSNILLISPFFVDARMKRADCYISTNELEMAIGDFSYL